MQSHGKLDNTQPRPKMAAGGGDRVDSLGAEFVGELSKFGDGEVTRIRRDADLVEKGR